MATTICLILSAILVIVDQISKYWAVSVLKEGGPIVLMEGVFHLQYTENRGVAFSMLEDQRWIFIPVSIALTVLLVVMLMRSPLRESKVFCVATSMVIAGAVGNLIDRVALGYVIDFLNFCLIDFPIFNFADCCVVVGAILLAVYVLFGVKEYEETPLRTLLFGIRVTKKES